MGALSLFSERRTLISDSQHGFVRKGNGPRRVNLRPFRGKRPSMGI
jgi:hypothetical protein